MSPAQVFARACAGAVLAASVLACVVDYELPALDCEAPLELCDGGCIDFAFDEDNCGACGLTCDAGEACISGVCEPFCDADCEAFEVCVEGVCECRDGLEECAGECVKLEADVDHCGACGSPCEGELCFEGECVSECPDEECGGACVDIEQDPLNCGACGQACFADELCVLGDCLPYDEQPGCNTCPCDCLPGSTCCYSAFLDAEVCIDGDTCNP